MIINRKIRIFTLSRNNTWFTVLAFIICFNIPIKAQALTPRDNLGGCPPGMVKNQLGDQYWCQSGPSNNGGTRMPRYSPPADVFGAISIQDNEPEKFGSAWGYDTAKAAVAAALEECQKAASDPSKCNPHRVDWFSNTCNGLAIAHNPNWGKGSRDAFWSNGAGKTRKAAASDAKRRCEQGSKLTCEVINLFCAYD